LLKQRARISAVVLIVLEHHDAHTVHRSEGTVFVIRYDFIIFCAGQAQRNAAASGQFALHQPLTDRLFGKTAFQGKKLR
ncbi:hypothetical protein, partial [Pseudomonas syringae group genomosp. 7]|uniref:hypothetical protein n=1 Tax=Pseudomonas syringae group genomosp. 7 TaxID=251699 RepID=UPI00376FF684